MMKSPSGTQVRQFLVGIWHRNKPHPLCWGVCPQCRGTILPPSRGTSLHGPAPRGTCHCPK